MRKPSTICLTLLRHDDCRAFSRARAKTGNRIAARIAMIAITTNNSISVKPLRMMPHPFMIELTTYSTCHHQTHIKDGHQSNTSGGQGNQSTSESRQYRSFVGGFGNGFLCHLEWPSKKPTFIPSLCRQALLPGIMSVPGSRMR